MDWRASSFQLERVLLVDVDATRDSIHLHKLLDILLLRDCTSKLLVEAGAEHHLFLALEVGDDVRSDAGVVRWTKGDQICHGDAMALAAGF